MTDRARTALGGILASIGVLALVARLDSLLGLALLLMAGVLLVFGVLASTAPTRRASNVTPRPQVVFRRQMLRPTQTGAMQDAAFSQLHSSPPSPPFP